MFFFSFQNLEILNFQPMAVTLFADDHLPNELLENKNYDILQIFDAQAKALQFHRRNTIAVIVIYWKSFFTFAF